MKDLKDIPEEVRKAHREKCSKCGTRKWYAKHLDMHFDYIDCPYDCLNNLEYLLEEDSDYIDRQAAIKAIERLILPQTKGETMAEEINRVAWRCAINCAEEMIGHLPPVEVEPVKHGRWTPVTNGRGGFECSICHSYAPSYQDGVEWLSPFCPNCGAKMEPISASTENGQEVEE